MGYPWSSLSVPELQTLKMTTHIFLLHQGKSRMNTYVIIKFSLNVLTEFAEFSDKKF